MLTVSFDSRRVGMTATNEQRPKSPRVECPLKSVQYQFATVFMTVVSNPLAPGSGTGLAINLRATLSDRTLSARTQDFRPVSLGETSLLTTDPDR